MLVAHFLDGDQRAFDDLYRRHAAAVGRRMQRVFGNRTDAEDMVQATFLQVHRSLARYDDRYEFGAWLHGIAFRVAGHELRARRRRFWQKIGFMEDASTQAHDPSAESAVHARAQQGQLMNIMYQALAGLSPDQRIAYTMHEIDDMGLTEIGEATGASPQAVYARVNSARKKVRKRLDAWRREQERRMGR